LEGITAAATACAIARQGIAVVGSKMAAPSKSAGKSHAMLPRIVPVSPQPTFAGF
jgi:hypothetical protein